MTFGYILEQKRIAIPKPWILRKQLNEVLADYKTTASKKAAIGREIKEQIYFISVLQEGLKKGKLAWYDGVQWSKHDLLNAIENLNVMLEVKHSVK